MGVLLGLTNLILIILLLRRKDQKSVAMMIVELEERGYRVIRPEDK